MTRTPKASCLTFGVLVAIRNRGDAYFFEGVGRRLWRNKLVFKAYNSTNLPTPRPAEQRNSGDAHPAEIVTIFKNILIFRTKSKILDLQSMLYY